MTEQKNISVREAEESLCIIENMLWKWNKENKEGKLQSFPGNGRMSDKDAEIARLKQENRRLQAERDILKSPQRCSLAPCKTVSIHAGTPEGVAH